MWTIYIVQCADQTLYTGITTDIDKRLKAHNSGRGAKYTRGRFPVKLVYARPANTKSEAAKEEARIKKLPSKARRLLCGLALRPKPLVEPPHPHPHL